jgi:hypothetical protein
MTSGADQRPSVKILVTVWGQSYIERFARFGLASMLAPGNLPAVASRWDVEFVILTSRADFDHFERLDLMRAARRFASVRYEAIDDLIVPGLFSVTLTLAYMRGVAMFGEAMTQSHFLFWNADFVLSAGAMTYLAGEIAADRKVILAGSLRAVSEDVEGLLNSRVEKDRVLNLTGRELTALALAHPHRMQIAKTVNQGGPWAGSPNHMFWTVGEDAVVARFWQIFMLCLKPTRVLTAIDGYCDYSFVPSLCPDAEWLVVGDSDDVCLLELQGRDADHEDVHKGPGREVAWLRSIREWCTPEHLEVARRPILFHAGEPPAAAADVVSASRAYVEAIADNIGARPPHPGHHYWLMGLVAWNARRRASEVERPLPAELERRMPLGALHHPTAHFARMDWTRGARARSDPAGRLQRTLVGDPATPTRLHPDRDALQAVGQTLVEMRQRLEQGGRLGLIVGPPLAWLDRIFPPDGRHLRADPEWFRIWTFTPEPPVDEAAIYLRAGSATPEDAAWLISATAGLIKPGGRLTILAHAPAYFLSDDGFLEAVARAAQMLGGEIDVRMVDAQPPALRYARKLYGVAENVRRHGAWAAIVGLAPAAGAVASRALRRPANGDARSVVAVVEVGR